MLAEISLCVSMKAKLARNTPPIGAVDPDQIFDNDALATVFGTAERPGSDLNRNPGGDRANMTCCTGSGKRAVVLSMC